MSGHTGTEHEHNQEHNPTSQDPKSGIAGAASDAASKTVSFMTAKLSTRTSRIAAVAVAGTLVLAGAGSAYAVHANDVSNHNKQVAAAQFAAEQKAAADKAQADAAAKAAEEKADPKQLRARFAQLRTAWAELAVDVQILPATSATLLQNYAARLDAVYGRLYGLMGQKGFRPSLVSGS